LPPATARYNCELAAITRLETRIAASRVYVTSAHCPHARGSGNATQYQASVNSVSGDQYLNLDASGAVLYGRNRHAAPGAHSRASLSVSRSVAQSRTGHFYRSVNELPDTN
jgi:hypothetical protein